jgi:hypothetical protein
MNTATNRKASEATTSAWIHPFERTGLGTAPFRCVGYEKSIYRDANGNTRSGSSCDVCGTSIMHVYHIQGTTGPLFKVGCDCVQRTHDTGLVSGMRREQHAVEYKAILAAERIAKADRDAARAARHAKQAAKNISDFAMFLYGCDVVTDCAHAPQFARDRARAVAEALRTGIDDHVTDGHFQVIGLAYLAAMLPAPKHAGVVGKRMRDVVCRYEGGPLVGLDSLYGSSTLANFRVTEGEFAGALLVWKTQGALPKKGDVVRLTGTVKEHAEYKGVLQTMVTRGKLG